MVTGCDLFQNKPVSANPVTTTDSLVKTIEDIRRPQIQLIGSAEKYATDWVGLQEVITLAESYTHSRTAADQWPTQTKNLNNTYPSELQEPIIRSRLKVLQTRAGMYHAMINRNTASLPQITEKYDELILAYEVFIDHLNDFEARKRFTEMNLNDLPEESN